ncbi:MAG: aminotransferase class I/II-fold pyridoxal phosphate-dependent enzyme [Planctomycetia bacterium]|nr:aminotransferase class I/II-fold pyridoxal phosphate-dependent enzyme [Planctomycetia bacterium]
MKADKSALSILGGPPAFAEPLHVGRPNVGDRSRLLQRIEAMLDRRWLSNQGPLVSEFEERIAAYVGAKHCIAMCNATVALEIAIRALGLTGEVIVPAFTFIATAHALQWQEITPVFCDIDPNTHTLDPEWVRRMITPRTSGIIGVHVWGRACPIDALTEIADENGLSLLFDAAHAFGASYRGRMIGGFGAAEVFSFHATKFINCGEGGAVVTNDDCLAEKMRLMRNFGFSGLDQVTYIGTNGKMPELSAAMGLTTFESRDEFVATNERNYRAYAAELASIPGLSLITYDPAERCNFQYALVEVDAAAAGLSRDELADVLWAENVRARRYFYPGCHRMEPYASLFPHASLVLRATEAVAGRVLLLPTGTAVGLDEIREICQILRLATGSAGDVRRALESRRQVPVERRKVA